MSLQRTRWHGPGQGSVKPVDEVAGLAQATVSLGTRELACQLDQGSRSFQRTAANLKKAAQVQASKETLRRVIEGEGRKVIRARQRGDLAPSWHASQCQVEDGKTRVYVSADGFHVPMITQQEKDKRRAKVRARRRQLRAQGKSLRPLPRANPGTDQAYKEFKLVAFYDQDQTHRHVVATRRDHRMARIIMMREGRRLGLHQADEKVANVDGALWIKYDLEGAQLGLDAIGLDFYHLSQNVHKARRAVFGEEDQAGRAWAHEVMHRVKHEGYEAFVQRLQALGKRRRGARRAAVERLLKYVEQRQDMIDYPRFLAAGWHIGSGPVESRCRTTPVRVKHCGRRWDAANADAVMALTALEESDQWADYWRGQLN